MKIDNRKGTLHMCLIVFSWKNHSRYDLLLAANRDEFYDRPTESASFWDEHPDVLAGRDITGGGTWLGVNRNGRFSAITNYRDMGNIMENAPTRGRLPLNYLNGTGSPSAYIQSIRTNAHRDNGYNLILGNRDELWYYSNIEDKPRRLNAGIYGLSNHLLDTPWHKVKRARQWFEDIIRDEEPRREELFRLLSDTEQAPDEVLPDTGLDKAMEKTISPVFIKSSGYGTRSSTILLIGSDGEIEFHEREYESGNVKADGDHRYRFTVSSE